MKTKFIYLNTIIILAIIFVSVFGDYFSPIEMKFQYWWSTKYIEWKELSILFLSFAIFSAVISLIKIKNLKTYFLVYGIKKTETFLFRFAFFYELSTYYWTF